MTSSQGTVAGTGSQSGRAEQLLALARAGDAEPVGQLLQLYRNYLLVLARTQFDRRLRRRMSPSDLVQEAMLAAHRDFAQFHGHSERQFLAWLRQILIHCLHRAIETHLKTKMRERALRDFDRARQRRADRSSAHAGRIAGRSGAVAQPPHESAKTR